ncbi:hypothetical protein LguiA_030034 [Lonicera macranthoides]
MSEKRALYDNLEDRISNLPRNLIDGILERMSTRNAARTSILSKKWRYIWSTHPQLVLDYEFFYGPEGKNVRWTASEYVKVINKILIVHDGTIQEFDLFIPFAQSPEMDLWILILSRHGIKDLTLDNAYSQPYKLPCYLFSCAELTSLVLRNFIISVPPLDFLGFRNLNKLYLEKISLLPKIGSLISTLPVLHDLWLKSCTGLENLKVMPPKLNWLDVEDSHKFQWQCLKIRNSNLKELYVALCKEVEQQKDFDLMVLLSNITKIRRLRLDGFSLKFLAAGTQKEYQPIKVYKLAKVRLFSFQFNDLEQVLCALCLLRSSPYLQYLKIEVSTFTNDGMQQVLKYMEASGHFNLDVLDKLQTVKLKSCISKAVLQFAKLLLSCSPSLQQMTIDNRRQSINADEQLRISTELMRFPRASTKAELIYLL